MDVCLWFFCGGLILWIARYLRWFIIHFHRDFLFLVKTPAPIKIAAFFLSLISLFYFSKYFIKKFITIGGNKDKKYKFRKNTWPDTWSFNGAINLGAEGLVIDSSRAGCLLEKHYWQNFKMSFDMKFENNDATRDEKKFGIIFRAENLDNYFMLEIGEHKTKNGCHVGIKPHIRFKGGWEELAPKKIDTLKLESSEFNEFILKVDRRMVYLDYKGENVFNWELPTHVDVNHYESGVREENNLEKRDTFLYQDHVRKIPFRLNHGLVGFRSHWNHVPAIIKDLKIKPL